MRRKGLLVIALVMTMCFGCQKADDGTKTDINTNKKENSEEKNKYSPIVANNETNREVEYPYVIKVNRKQNCVTVYGADDTGKYIIPVRAMICSTGGKDTPLGTFQLGETSRWMMEADGEFSQYATSIVDDVVFQSAPYYSQNNDDLNVEQFNKLGEEVSGNSIQLEVADAKWIAVNCPAGTKVEIYEDKKQAGPLGKPDARNLKKEETVDPTDKEKDVVKGEDYVPVVFNGISDKKVVKAQKFNVLEGVSAVDSEKNDLTAGIQVIGQVDVNHPGKYEVTYVCSTEDEETRVVKRNIEVVEKTEAQATPKPQATKTPDIAQNDNTASSDDVTDDAEDETVHFPYPYQELVSEEPEATPTPKPIKTPKPTAEQVRNYKRDRVAPNLEIVATTRLVHDVQYDTLRQRVLATDNLNQIDNVYITVQPIEVYGYYVVVYEAIDTAGNCCCISETVQIENVSFSGYF